jgi:hypothetical protein
MRREASEEFERIDIAGGILQRQFLERLRLGSAQEGKNDGKESTKSRN